MSEQPFWQQKTLDEMSDAEWESLCDGCGQCCLHKLMDEDTDEIYFTNVACRQLNIKTCQCRNYERRFEYEPDCIKLTRDNLPTFEWLPPTCAYRLLGRRRVARTYGRRGRSPAAAALASAVNRFEGGDAWRTHLGSPYCGERSHRG